MEAAPKVSTPVMMENAPLTGISYGDGLRPVALRRERLQNLAGVGRQQRNARTAHGHGEPGRKAGTLQNDRRRP